MNTTKIMPQTTYGLIAGRHDLPVCGYILDQVEDVMDFTGIRRVIGQFLERNCNLRLEYRMAVNQGDDESIKVYTGDSLDVIVTGLSAATAALVSACACNGVNLTLWHYDRETGEYQPQRFWF